ncbi:aminoacyl-tRNA hydrolase [Bdellovibrio sp. SKB1291214]|uniref:aminoacyl-tRNA hydrolase n=1 Tax=Bdellovibrio sp. SKB1291214 TaxID=1732569 RepID=UPI000B51D586|nr:aminoacyl-tRNA hydrolase [Bdellovibrio sp. SKB1291214]UYL09483.1 aminoacyl-tRNA hydrolase [Bdellovibrio sp. SKB1291214]
MSSWLIVGLGNPGGEYKLTRHNIGFMAVDYFMQGLGNPSIKNQFKAEVAQATWQGHTLYFCKPQTYMNLSGESVQPLMGYYKIPQEHLIVIHDDIDQPFNQMKIHKNRGHGGHNGIKSISQLLGSQDYARLKLGVGRPENPNYPVADYVLGKFTKEEFDKMPDFLNKGIDAIESIILDGIQKASTKFNG